MKHIVCIGDSLTYGSRDEFGRSYPAELSKIFWEQEKKKVNCIVKAIPGQSSSDLLKRIYVDCQVCKDAMLGLLMIGTNDTKEMNQYPVEVFQDNLRQILNVMVDSFDHVGVAKIPYLRGTGLPIYCKKANKIIDIYNESVLQLVKEYGRKVFYVDFGDMSKHYVDGVHFNNDGYKKMAKEWYREIKEKKIIL